MSTAAVRLRAAVCVHDAGRILLVEHDKAGRRSWLLPGGGVEVGETLVAAARREAREETGYEVDVGRLLLVCEAVGTDADGPRHVVQLVFAGRLAGGSLAPRRDGRVVGAAWQPVEALPGLSFFPPIAAAVVELCGEGLAGPVRHLGNVFV